MDAASQTAEVSVQSLNRDVNDDLKPESGRRAVRTRRLQLAKAFVEDNLHHSELTPTATAAALGISVRQLHMLFEPTGVSFSTYLLQRRLERARDLLAAQPQNRVMEIAAACGIRSSTVFYRGFQQAFGTTPTEFRRTTRDGEPPHGEVSGEASPD